MTEIAFYHFTTTPLERVLPPLLEKVLKSHKRAIILCGSEERLNFLNSALWTLGKLSFLPHGSAKEGFAADQPIWLTTQDENPNGAQFLVLTDGAQTPSFATYERCFDLFDGNDPDAVSSASRRGEIYEKQGHSLTYWKQAPSGTWEKEAFASAMA